MNKNKKRTADIQKGERSSEWFTVEESNVRLVKGTSGSDFIIITNNIHLFVRISVFILKT